MRLVSKAKGTEHRITIPKHKPLRVGTLSRILKEIAGYLEKSREELLKELFSDRS